MSQLTVKKCEADKVRNAKEKSRLSELQVYEQEARKAGYQLIAGVDEAGRGPLAGPVVACACIIPQNILIVGVDDSKKLLPKKRQQLFQTLTAHQEIIYGIGIIEHDEIDRVNIYQATILAMKQAVEALKQQPDYLLIDGLGLPQYAIPNKKVIGGDSSSYLIAAASIIAKETRDRIMEDCHAKWPEYGFNKHKGYGTQFHRDAIEKYGACPIHRLSFEPLKSLPQK